MYLTNEKNDRNQTANNLSFKIIKLKVRSQVALFSAKVGVTPGWHENKHDPWPYINYILFILKTAYQEFAERVGNLQAPRGSKTEMVLTALQRLPKEFSVAQLEQASPGVSREMVRRILSDQKGKTVECIGRGPGAKWIKKG